MLDNTRKRHSQGHAVSPNDTNIVLRILIMPRTYPVLVLSSHTVLRC